MSALAGAGGEAPADGPPPDRTDRLVLGLALAAALGVVLVVFRVDYLPTVDGPHHLFLGHLENHFDDPGAAWSTWLERGAPFTGLGFHLLFSLLERFFAWRRAFQLTLVITALGWGASYLSLTRALHPRRAALGLLGFATAISWSVYMGFFAFTMSIALGFAVLAIAAGAWPWTGRRRALLAALLFLQAVVHAFGAELTGLCLALLVGLAPAPPRGRARELGLLALMGLPAALIAIAPSNQAAEPNLWLSLGDLVRVIPRAFLPGPAWRYLTPLALGLGGVALTVARRRRGAASAAEIALAAAAALHLVAAFAAPVNLSAWQLFSPRFLPFGCMLGAALLPLERLDERRRLHATLGLAAFTAASLLWAARTATALRAQEDEALSGLSAPLHRTGPRLVVDIDALAAQRGSLHHEIPYYAPLFNLGPLYAIEQGGLPPYGFVTNPRLHAFVMSEAGRARYPALPDPAELLDVPVRTDPAARAGVVTFLAALGASFQDVVLHGRAEDGDLLAERGYAADFRRGGLFVGHLEGCPLVARITGAAPADAPIVVEYGVDPLPLVLKRSVLAPAAEGDRELPLEPALCGRLWLRAAVDRDRSGSPSKGDAFCTGADPTGRLRFAAQGRARTVVECRLAL